MRGILSPKLTNFIEQANLATEAFKSLNIKLTPELIRAGMENFSNFMDIGPQITSVKKAECITASHTIPVIIYNPAPENALPVVLHFHGGGHVCGNIALYDSISRKIAKAGNCIVIAVEYRLAPEHPYPEGLNDCEYALKHYRQLLTNTKHTNDVIILGDSAGGAFCASLADKNQRDSSLKIDKQILIYPSVDYTLTSESLKSNGEKYLLETEKIEWYFEQYFQHNEDRKVASPLHSTFSNNFSSSCSDKLPNKLPKTLIFTCGCDPLRDEGIAYYKALKNAEVNAEHKHFPELIHAYMLLDKLLQSECEETYQLIGDFIKQK